MDVLRSWGNQPDWHFICQWYYDAWAAALLLTGMIVEYKKTRNEGRYINPSEQWSETDRDKVKNWH